MTHLRFAGAALAAMSIAATAADQEWKTVTLRDEPGLTISIPVAAVNEADPEDPDSLMFFSVVSRMAGSLTCMATRADYCQGITRECNSGERRGGKEGVSMCGTRWWPYM